MPLQDILTDGLRVVFVGYNPGRYSAERGHHFAGPGNRFWALLYESGLTGRRLDWAEDGELPFWGIGIANLVERPTPGAAELTPEELRAGAARLRGRLERYRPRVVCCLGKEVYRYFATVPHAFPLTWGYQATTTVVGARDFIAPNPSGRSTVPYGVRLRVFRELAGYLRYGIGGDLPT
jgi:mismatch-specific thymine-DNA glycosylase